ncbi:MAG: PKD domain-containing protein [Candidatus Omnitrophota bacterium]
MKLCSEAESPAVAIIKINTEDKDATPLKVRFCAGSSYSSSGAIVSYLWDFGDGSLSRESDPEHIFYNFTWWDCKYYNIKLTVIDKNGVTAVASVVIKVNPKW